MKKLIQPFTSKVILLSLLTSPFLVSVEAAVIYEFKDGSVFDGGTTGVVGASDSLTDGSITFNLTTFDIIGITSSAGTLTSAKDDGDNHRTNIFNDSTGLGIASDDDGTDEQNSFDYGEAWQFSFDNDVEFNAVNLTLLEGSQTLNLTFLDGTNSGSGTSFSLSSGDNTGIDYSVSSGTVMEFRAGTGSERARVGSLTVTAIPEPSTLILLGISLASLAAFRRRK